MSALGEYQSAAVKDLRHFLAQGYRAPSLLLRTGAGKTQVTYHPIGFKTIEAHGAQRCEAERDRQRVHGCEWEMDDQWQFFSELKAIAARHGYQSGWVAHKYRARIRLWPNAIKDTTPPVEPLLATQVWVGSQNIRVAKRREARS